MIGSLFQEDEEVTLSMPVYGRAANNHNIAATQTSWLSPETYVEKAGNMGKFIAVSALSGVNGFIESAKQVGRWAGMDLQEESSQKWITSLDSDLGKYYSENQEWADLAGFIGTSLIPGMAGVKALNAGQSALKAASAGRVGGNMSFATKLFTNPTDDYLNAAAQQINASMAATRLTNANTLKAIGSGAWQGVLETVAFETMVYATMFKNPILEQQDFGDFTKNLFYGSLIGAGVGGAFAGAGVYGKLKNLVGQEKAGREPFIRGATYSEKTPWDEKIIFLASDLEQTPIPIKLIDGNGNVVENSFDISSKLYRDKETRVFNEIRTGIQELSGGDSHLANLVADASTPMRVTDGPATGYLQPGFSQGYFESFAGVKHFTRVNKDSPLEVAAAAALKKGEPMPPLSRQYLVLHGDDAGTVLNEAPIVPWLGDTLSSADEILSKVKGYGFNVKSGGKTWSARDLKGSKAHLEAEARYIWARHLLQQDKIPAGYQVSEYDIPLLEALYKSADEKWRDVKIVKGEGPSLESVTLGSKEELFSLLKEAKEEVASNFLVNAAMKKSADLPIEVAREQAAKIAGTSLSYLDGARTADNFDALFRYDAEWNKAKDLARKKELSTNTPELTTDPLLQPRHAKIVYEAQKQHSDLSMGYQDAMVYFAQKQKLYEQEAKQVAAEILGRGAEQLPDTTMKTLTTQDHAAAGAGLFSFANSNYGSLGSAMQFIGSKVRQFKEIARKETTDALTNPLARLAQNADAAFEFESINRKVAGTPDLMVFRRSDELGAYLIPKKFAAAVDSGELDIQAIQDSLIRIQNTDTADAVAAHIQQTGKRTADYQKIQAQRGHTDTKDPTAFRPIRPDLSTYKHFAFVVDENVAGSGHVQMIHAASEKELQELASRVPPYYKTLFKDNVEEFKKARGEYEYSKGLNENYIDSDLKSKGVFTNFFPKTDPQKIVDDVLQQHLRQSDLMVTEAVRLRYEHTFQGLEQLAKTYSTPGASFFGGSLRKAEKVLDDPYTNHMKTALDISKASEYPLLYSVNQALDTAVSRAYASVKQAWDGAKSPEELDKINGLLQKYGMNTAYYDAALDAYANHTAPKGVLTKFIRQSNAILSRFVLGLDPFNAMNNAIGSNILRTTELQSVLRAIEGGNKELAGELAALGKSIVPGTEDAILTPGKLIANAFANFWKDGGLKPGVSGPLIQKYKDLGVIKDLSEQLKLLADDFTLTGTETVEQLNSKLSAGWQRAKALAKKSDEIGEKGEKLTGNKLAEELNRFVSANVMDQITSLAVKHGVMDQPTANAYINSFVNRVEGTIVASQRPLIFQGPVGQAIGLFQSYQFNLMQQMFRYVAEGTKKDLAMMAGLQGTFYGLNSMPAFQYINTHVLGQLSGNTEHKDAYDAAYGILGKGAGDFFLYGLPSNLLSAGIYSRGDINPRQITILPTDLNQIPLVQGWGKFFGSMKDTLGAIGGGAPVWDSFLRGLEHNGISRPLAGLGQVMRAADGGVVFSTQKDGSLLYQNDLFSLASLTRLAGARPLDEAIANDGMYRVKVYNAAKAEGMKSLGEKVKMHLYNNGEIPPEDMQEFMKAFVEKGGKQKEFNRWMMRLYKDTNVAQSDAIANSLSQPYSYKMQLLLGGQEP